MALLPDLVGRIRLDLSDLTRAQGEATSRGAAIGSALGTAVGSLAGGLLAAAGQRLLEFVSGSVDAFAKLEDSTAAAGTVFGTAFSQVDQFAAGAAQSLGLSKTAALEGAITFGTFGKQAGFAGNDLAGFSTGLVSMAGNMASFRGTTPEQAIEAIGAAFRGETDPIEQYGVMINQAQVKQEAMRMGLIPLGGELDNHARILATQSLILKQTADAQGDFARTSDSTANTQKRLAAETANAQAALGEKLAPAMTALRELLLGVLTGLNGFIDGVAAVARVVWEWKDAIGAVLIVIAILNAQTIAANVAMAAYLAVNSAVRIATTAWTAVQWLLNAALTANPIGLVIAAIAALVAGIVIAYNHSETFRNIVNQLWEALKSFIAWIGPAWESFKNAVVNAFVSAGQKIVEFHDWVTAMPGRIGSALASVPGLVWGLIVEAWNRVTTGVNQANNVLFGYIGSIPGRVAGFLSGVAGDVWRFIVDGWNRMVSGINQANQVLFGFIGSIPGRITGFLGRVAGDVWNMIVGGFQRTIGGVQAAANNVLNFVRGIPGSIVNALGNIGGLLFGIGQDIIGGMLRGLQSMGGQIVAYLTNLIPGPVRQALGIASPSKVMIAIGEDTMRGLDEGLRRMQPMINARMNGITASIQATLPGGRQVSGSVGVTSQQTARGRVYNIDARSFGTQISPDDVATAIMWASKVGGLVPA